MKFIIFIISFCCCIAGALKKPAPKNATYSSAATITMPDGHSSTGNDDLSPSSAFNASAAQVNFFAALIPNKIESAVRHYSSTTIFQSAIVRYGFYLKSYLLHIHPSHSIW